MSLKIKTIKSVHPGGCKHREVELSNGRKFIFHDRNAAEELKAELDLEIAFVRFWINEHMVTIDDYRQLEGVVVGGVPKRAARGTTFLLSAEVGH